MESHRRVFAAPRPQIDDAFNQPSFHRDQPDQRPRPPLYRDQNILMPHRSVPASQFRFARLAQPPLDRRQRAAQRMTQRSPRRTKRLRIGDVESELIPGPPITGPARRPHDHRVGGLTIQEAGRIAKINLARPLPKTSLERDRHALPAAKIFRIQLLGRAGPGRFLKQETDLFDQHSFCPRLYPPPPSPGPPSFS